MLAHSPPLPLVLHYMDTDRNITAAEEEGIILALEQRHRVHRIRFFMPTPNLERLIKAIDMKYPVLEYLIMTSLSGVVHPAWVLPTTLQAPHLRCLLLKGFTLPLGLMTAKGIVALYLIMDDISAYCSPYSLFLCISFMRKLETLRIIYSFPISNHVVERLLQLDVKFMSTTTHVTYPNLRWFEFQGASAYMEAFVHRINAPRLKKLHIQLCEQPTFSVPRLLRLMNTTKKLRFDSAKFEFSSNRVSVGMNFPEEEDVYAFSVAVYCLHLGLQVSSLAQIFNSLSQRLSTVEHLTFEHDEDHDEPEVDRTEWHRLLKSFINVKTLSVDDRLVDELSRCLRLNDGEHPLEVLPELHELSYTGTGDIGDTFTSFLDSRQNSGHPVDLLFPNQMQVWSGEAGSNQAGSNEAGGGEAGSDLDA
jgi:hypothetical protein